MADLTLSSADQTRIGQAVTAAEAHTSGEIVTIIARASHDYEDISSDWAAFVALLALVAFATMPHFYGRLVAALVNDWSGRDDAGLAPWLIAAAVLVKFVAVKLLLLWRRLRLAMTPRFVKRHRVYARATLAFKLATQQRTSGATGVLIYLSQAERMGVILAEQAINARVEQRVWDGAMASLVAEVKQGRVADGMIAAIAQVGAVLTAHFPRADHDVNELPDRVIEL